MGQTVQILPNLFHHGETTYRVGWLIWISYSRALEKRCLTAGRPGNANEGGIDSLVKIWMRSQYFSRAEYAKCLEAYGCILNTFFSYYYPRTHRQSDEAIPEMNNPGDIFAVARLKQRAWDWTFVLMLFFTNYHPHRILLHYSPHFYPLVNRRLWQDLRHGVGMV